MGTSHPGLGFVAIAANEGFFCQKDEHRFISSSEQVNGKRYEKFQKPVLIIYKNLPFFIPTTQEDRVWNVQKIDCFYI